jgi:NTP pyrophosphatase (non-canonical NTP hydrolase)
MQSTEEGSVKSFNEIRDEVHANAVSKGFHSDDEPRDLLQFGSKLMLIVSEVSEALEEARNGMSPNEVYFRCGADPRLTSAKQSDDYKKPEGIPIELADIIIRVLDLAGKYGIDVDEAIRLKMTYNATRPAKHGKTF